MNLVIDVGNSDVVFGLENNSNYPHIWRIESDKNKLPEEYELNVRQHFLENDIDFESIETISISSVVPDLNQTLLRVCHNLFNPKPFFINGDVITKLDLGIDNPYEIGTDLASNAVGAFSKYQQACIVIDFGTALTFTSVSGQGKILGVAIAPGVKTAMKALSSNTAKLPEIPLEIPEKIIGRNTVQAMQSGIMQGYVGLVKHMIEKTREEMKENPKIIATGGLSFIFKPLHNIIDEINPNLTLDG
ncbi:MAG: type III pantothenate kinase, partial [Cyclobacteriaceae bacterium]|nr:type III pantothenate kinase [Cyclobacteriaceae bacterium]